ncbi:MAG: hypothetical protein R3F40_14370 [Candidatus Competibacteraceae bacterium]
MASTNSRVKASPAPTATRTDLAPVLQPYIEAALADRTRQEYRADLRRFLRWVEPCRPRPTCWQRT